MWPPMFYPLLCPLFCDENGNLAHKQNQQMPFIQLIYSCFPKYHGPTNSASPLLTILATSTQNSLIHSDEELTLEMLTNESLYGAHITLSAMLIKPNILVYSATNASPH